MVLSAVVIGMVWLLPLSRGMYKQKIRECELRVAKKKVQEANKNQPC